MLVMATPIELFADFLQKYHTPLFAKEHEYRFDKTADICSIDIETCCLYIPSSHLYFVSVLLSNSRNHE